MNHNSKNTQKSFSFLFFQATTPNSDTIYQWPNIRNVPLGHITREGEGGKQLFCTNYESVPVGGCVGFSHFVQLLPT